MSDDETYKGPDRRDRSTLDRRRLLPRARLHGGRRAYDGKPAEWLSVKDFADKYGIGTDTVHKWIKSDVLLIYKMGALIRIRDIRPDEHERLIKLNFPQADADRNQPKPADSVK
jgi:hypothetical protein